ncbi:MAG: YihY/virulence factor BrkB family protein [Kutzneria sp.]|nr:YihY/virulence factor BrkB family protein [Kutzneria sp.]
MRAEYPWLDHLARAGARYGERYGDHYAASITYYSVLSLIPMLMLGFSVAGYVLAGDTTLLVKLKDGVVAAVPGELGGQLATIVDKMVDARGSMGIVGLLAAAYSGLGWMTSLRDALTAQWTRSRPELPILRTAVKDLLALIGLGLSLLVSLGIAAIGTSVGTSLLDFVGLTGSGPAGVLLTIGSLVLGLLTSWLIFLWVLSGLPRVMVGVRSAVRGAVAGAVGFEVLKQVGNVYLQLIKGSPAFSVLGTVLGLLVFINLVSRLLVFVTAWTATARENVARSADPADEPPRVVAQAATPIGSAPDIKTAAGLLGVGTVIGLALGRLGRRL